MDMKSQMSYLRAFPILSWHSISHSQTFLHSNQGHPAYIMLQRKPPTVLVCDTTVIRKKLALVWFSPYQVAQRSRISVDVVHKGNSDVATLALQSLPFNVPYYYCYFTIYKFQIFFFPGIFSPGIFFLTVLGIQEDKVFLNGRQKHMDSWVMLAKVLFFTNVLKAVRDILNAVADVWKIMFFVLQERTTMSGDQDP